MTRDGSAERDDRPVGDGPWWVGVGPIGAVVLIVVGIVGEAWVVFRWPGLPDEPDTAYYGVSRVLAIGLVLAGTALLGRLRTRAGKGPEGEEGGEG
ncbi:hypothetical protein [Streptomyces pinistramenti]|uniref:hypothetical protein n=1 Tax=Streptomyces pinistramenti TaxID=2884812 RepID=UPI001D075E16|nr:hypothetical protein [Streptomyces pinistramenti]MCB5910840.1 hypothetical protein [Streptomyces pinistramenti]